MASRRIRIKTVTNIPPRRKNGLDEASNKIEKSSITDTNPESENVGEIGVESLKKSSQESALSVNSEETVNAVEEELLNNCNESKKDDPPIYKVLKTESSTVHSVNNISIQKDQPKDSPIIRRKFIKPTISVHSLINRKPKADLNKINGVQNEEIENVVITRDEENRKPIDLESGLETFQNNHATINIKEAFVSTSSISNGEITLHETNLIPNVNIQLNRPAPSVNQPKKPVNLVSNAYCSDTEYPPPPPSPSKINRTRIKAIPRLAHRKTSFSASESEDENRRNSNRNRNDSVCSAASGVVETLTECMSPQRPKETNPVVQKKCPRTEQTRKIAEARREFQRRFGASKPDRQRLTMMDLIFYNPSTNPMIADRNSKEDTCDDPQETETLEETNSMDNERQEDNCEKSDEENEMPVPQIKIGPSGEIILDEKSLVIERKKLKKQREELQKTQLIDGDFNTTYGIYKKQKKTKAWTHSETLRFYKALNTLGTDFTLMNELFPKRTRRELKMKFNREEKANRMLIDKALMQPCNFNYNELKLELDNEEKELEELQKQKEENIKLRQEKMENIRKRKAAKSETTVVENKKIAPKPPKIRKVRKKKEKLSIEHVCMDNSDADESDIETQSESDEELILCQKPTRSGRVPKVTQKFDLGHEDKYEKCSNIGNIIRKSKISQEMQPNNIEPGSIMIITEKGESDEPVYKIYMVTQNNNAAPVDLTTDLVSKAIDFKKGVSAQNILTISTKVTDDEDENHDTAPLEENNITIVEDGEITLKSKPTSAEGTISKDATVSSI